MEFCTLKMAKDRTSTKEGYRGDENRSRREKHRSDTGIKGSKAKQTQSGIKRGVLQSRSTERKNDREQRATNVIERHLPRPWLRWSSERGEDNLAWMPAEIRVGLDKLDGTNPWLQYRECVA